MESAPREPQPQRPADAPVDPPTTSPPSSVSVPQIPAVPPAEATKEPHAAATTAGQQPSVERSVPPQPSLLPGERSLTSGPTAPANQAAPEGNAAEPSRSPPDSLGCWLVVLSSSFCIFFSMALMKSESALYVGILETFNATRQSASWPLTVSITLSQLAGPVYGVLGTWLSDRILFLMGAFCCSVPVMISSFTHEIWEITISYGLFSGLGIACAEVMPFAVVSRHFVRHRGAAVGVLFIVTALSGFVWPLVIVALRTGLGFRTALLVLGALELNMFFGGLFVDRVELQAPTPPEAAGSADHKPGTNGEMPRGTQRLSPAQQLMRNLVSLATVPFFHVAASRAISVFGIQTFLLSAEDFGRDNGLEEFEATSLVSAFAAGDMVARIGTGIVLDYKILSGPYLMLWTFAANTASIFVLGCVKNYWLMVGSCFISGICGGSHIFTANIMVAQFFEDRVLQLGLGVMNFVAGVAIFARPPLVGYSKDVLGAYEPMYIGIGICYALFTASWVVSCLWKRLKKPQDDSPVNKVAGGAQPAKPS